MTVEVMQGKIMVAEKRVLKVRTERSGRFCETFKQQTCEDLAFDWLLGVRKGQCCEGSATLSTSPSCEVSTAVGLYLP